MDGDLFPSSFRCASGRSVVYLGALSGSPPVSAQIPRQPLGSQGTEVGFYYMKLTSRLLPTTLPIFDP